MNISGKISKTLDWIISVLITAFVLSMGVVLWDDYSGISGFFKDVFGIFTTPIPVPFWVATLVGVALSIFFYRKYASSKNSESLNNNSEN